MKIVLAILATIYLFTSIGAPVELHYCMGKFADGSLWHSKSSKCSICGMQKNRKPGEKGCCKNEYKLAKVEQDQRVTESLTGIERKLTEVLPMVLPDRASALRGTVSTSRANAPERSSPHSLHKLNCVLRI